MLRRNFLLATVAMALFVIPACETVPPGGHGPANSDFGKKLLKEADGVAYVQIDYFDIGSDSRTKNQSTYCSGFLIKDKESGEYYVVSVAHLGPADKNTITKITIWFKKGWAYFESYQAELLGYDGNYDCAILKIKDKNFSFDGNLAVLGDSSKVAVGDNAAVVGCPKSAPRSYPFQVRAGKILATGDFVAGENKKLIPVLVHNCATEPGNSGSPLLNEKGEVIGIHSMHSATSELKFAIPINYFKDVFEKLKAGFKRAGAQPKEDYRKIICD